MHMNNPSIPFCSPVGVYISPGTIIQIKGNVPPYCQCFAINLQCGGSVNPRDDVALHLSPVFSPPPRVVRNSIHNNSWGAEESFGGFPLSPGQMFEFMILIEPNQFKIALNSRHFTEFQHRLPFEKITHLAIDGEVRIDIVNIDSASSASISPQSCPMTSASGMPPYPMSDGCGLPPYPMASGSRIPPYPTAGGSVAQPYPPMGFEMAGAPYPPEAPPAYSSAPYTPVPSSYTPSVYPTKGGSYPQSDGYPAHQKTSSGLGGKVGAALGGLTAGVAATSIGSALLGSNKHHHGHGSHMEGPSSHKSSSIPIGKIAAGAGAAVLGAAVLSKVKPFKKAKKMFKHKGGWHHKGWSSSSSSSSSEEE